MHRQAIFLALALFSIVTGHNINAIVKSGGNYYAFDGFPFLSWPDKYQARAWEVVGSAQTEVFTLHSPNTSAILESSRVHDGNLYQFQGAYGEGYLAQYTFPFASATPTPTHRIHLDNQIQEIPAIFDFTDNLAFALVSRYLTVINLSPMKVYDNILAVSGSGKTPGSLVYNHASNRIFYFQTDYCEFGYCQHIFMFHFDDSTHKLTELDETFKPAYKTHFNKGALSGCALDHSTHAIYCINHAIDALFKFPLSNLNDHTRFNLPSDQYEKGNVAYDFSAKRAYVISTAEDAEKYGVYEVNLANGNALRHKNSPGNKVVSVSIHGDTLALGHAFDDVRSMSLVDIPSFTAKHVNLTL